MPHCWKSHVAAQLILFNSSDQDTVKAQTNLKAINIAAHACFYMHDHISGIRTKI